MAKVLAARRRHPRVSIRRLLGAALLLDGANLQRTLDEIVGVTKIFLSRLHCSGKEKDLEIYIDPGRGPAHGETKESIDQTREKKQQREEEEEEEEGFLSCFFHFFTTNTRFTAFIYFLHVFLNKF